MGYLANFILVPLFLIMTKFSNPLSDNNLQSPYVPVKPVFSRSWRQILSLFISTQMLPTAKVANQATHPTLSLQQHKSVVSFSSNLKKLPQ